MKHQNNSLKKNSKRSGLEKSVFSLLSLLAYEYFPRVFTSMYGYAFHLKK